MTKRWIALVLCALAMVVPAHAGTKNDLSYTRVAQVQWYSPASGQGGFVTVVAVTREASAGPTVTRTEEYRASAVLFDNDPCCSSTFYPDTVVPASALSIDPVGNSAQIRLTLGVPQLLVVDLTLSRPETMAINQASPQPNLWVDGSDPGAQLDIDNVGLFLGRTGYRLSGSVNGIPLPSGTPIFTYTGQSIYEVGVSAQLP